MSNDEVTVVIPTRNRVALLAITLATVRAQTGVRPEVVIVDDGSEPESAAELQKLRDERTTVLRNDTSRGAAAARNQGLRAASTRWVAVLDDDDLWTPTKLAGQLAAVRKAGTAWVYSGAVKFELGPTVWQLMPPPSPDEARRRLADHNIIPAGASNVLMDRETAFSLGGFDEGLQHLADWDLWLRLLSAGPPAVASPIAVAYRLHAGMMSLNPKGALREVAVLDARWRRLREGRRLSTGPTHLWIARSYLRTGNRMRAALSYGHAVRSTPKAALRGLFRTLHPAPPTPPHVIAGRDAPRPRFKKTAHIHLSDEMAALLDGYATLPGDLP